jgi:Fic family protein
MPRYEDRLWAGDPTGQTRKDREPFRYRAYVPDFVAEAEFPAPGPLASAISDAERAAGELNRTAASVQPLEAVARQLLRAESVASSRIEGLEMSHQRLARVAHAGADARDESAASILGNIRAMEQSIAFGSTTEAVDVNAIAGLHRTLMTSTRDAHRAGVVRVTQNWLGGSQFSPRGAEFIPPPPELVESLLADLAKFMNREDMPAVQQAAIAHAQFETIHPFGDGNGRVGRCLIHVVLRRRGVAPRYVPPISLVLAARADDYVRGLTAFRAERWHEWCLFFADVTAVASREAVTFADRVGELQQQWREQARVRRRDAAAAMLIEKLPEQPIVDVKSAQAVIGGSDERSRLALNRLEEAGVLEQVTLGKRNRVWEAAGLYEALDGFEDHLAGLGP